MNRDERTVFSLGAFVVAVFAIFVAFWAVFLVRDDDGSGAGAVAAPATIDVDLSDFKIGPPSLDIPESGATLRLTNSGSSAHNLAIPELNVQSDGRPTGRIGHGDGRRLDRGRHVRDALHDRRSRRCRHEGHGAHRRRGDRHRRHDGWFDDSGQPAASR